MLHWRYFIFAWLFPVFVYATFVVMSSLVVVSARASVGFFLMIVAVLVFWVARQHSVQASIGDSRATHHLDRRCSRSPFLCARCAAVQTANNNEDSDIINSRLERGSDG